MEDFNISIEGDRGSRPDCVDWFPVQEQLLDGFKPEKDAVLLVDVAGGRGRDIALFKNKPRRSGPLDPARLGQGYRRRSRSESRYRADEA